MNVVITGTSSGIGHALALRLLGRRHKVWGLARSDQSAEVARHGGSFLATKCDVSKWDLVSKTADEVGRAWDHLDALVTCAGIHGAVGRAVASNPVAWSETIRANLDATFFSIRAFHPLLKRCPRRAKIVCLSGGGATKPRPNFSAYGAAKTAIVRLVETIAEEEKGSPLDVNCLAPGAINTRLTDEIVALGPTVVGTEEFEAASKNKASGSGPLERALDAVEWLISPASDGITGRLLSAAWDPVGTLSGHLGELSSSDIYTLRRITPKDRGLGW